MLLHLESYGQGEPVLILHGLFGSCDNWQTVSRHLSDSYRVVAADLRNHGRSPHSDVMDLQVMTKDILEVLQAEGLSQTHLIGHSLGGKTAMQFALEHPDRLLKLIVVDIAPHAYEPRHNDLFSALRRLDLAMFSDRRPLEQALEPAIPDLATRRLLLKNLARDPAGKFFWRIGLNELWENYPNLNVAVTGSSPFTGSALFIRGEHSDYLSEEDFPGIRVLFPHAEFTTIPGAGHLPHTENAADFLRVVRSFLENSERGL
ncbi:MAG TPA: alpha/beta fold hydrolase [Verrucomicrobiae bacterium]|nr:alpha/beta fold hydrolase [Verrucomicrobiae bacterium]